MLLLDDDDELAEAPDGAEASFAAKLGDPRLMAIHQRILEHSSTRQYEVARVIWDAISP